LTDLCQLRSVPNNPPRAFWSMEDAGRRLRMEGGRASIRACRAVFAGALPPEPRGR
jgi:hypothetical protein